ncbi:MAG TPA: hypothetical protein VK442_00120 [Xanthobacteraceae bacterium]|nr:hypothetical protein [Xanthobacteraceae bacterium]
MTDGLVKATWLRAGPIGALVRPFSVFGEGRRLRLLYHAVAARAALVTVVAVPLLIAIAPI